MGLPPFLSIYTLSRINRQYTLSRIDLLDTQTRIRGNGRAVCTAYRLLTSFTGNLAVRTAQKARPAGRARFALKGHRLGGRMTTRTFPFRPRFSHSASSLCVYAALMLTACGSDESPTETASELGRAHV